MGAIPTIFTLGPFRVPPIDNLPDSNLQIFVKQLLDFAKSRSPIDVEHTKFEFKEKLNITNKDEVRKDFASFANTEGGLILVGIKDKTLEVVGINADKHPPDEQIRQILSAGTRIRPRVEYSWRSISNEGKRLVLYQIRESAGPVEVYDEKAKRWKVYKRYGSTTAEMSPVEIMHRFYRGARKLPSYLQVDTMSLGFYSPDGARRSSIRWTIKGQGDIYKWLQSMWTQLIPIPVPTIPFDSYSDLYGTTTRWTGNSQDLPDILLKLENGIQETHGIICEFWTMPMPGSRTLLEDHFYLTGCDASALTNSIADISKKEHLSIFGWILFAGSVVYIIAGEIWDGHSSIDANSRIAFIPNNFPLVCLDDIGRVIVEPLPVHKIHSSEIKRWKQPVDNSLFLDDVPDPQLAVLPSAKIVGYLGQEPRQRIYGSPFRAKGLTVIDLVTRGTPLEGAPPIITEVAPLFCRIALAPSGLNDLEEVRLAGLETDVLPIPQYPLHDFSIILFDIGCSFNQSKTLKLAAADKHTS
jgi:hypothetical protein